MAYVKRDGWHGLEPIPEYDGSDAKLTRERLNITQEKMGTLMGCSERTVRTWENSGNAYHFNRLQREKLHVLFQSGREEMEARWGKPR